MEFMQQTMKYVQQTEASNKRAFIAKYRDFANQSACFSFC